LSAAASAAYWIDPPHPPLPTSWNFPFQPVSGSHTSDLMSESDDGLMTSVTRQKAGSVGATSANPFVPAGAANFPALTPVTEVTVVFGSFRDEASLVHAAASTERVCATPTVAVAHAKTNVAAATDFTARLLW
jgi:hypothetical protein